MGIYLRICLVVIALGALGTATAAAKPVPTSPDPAVAKWADWPYLVSCRGDREAFDPLQVFSGTANAEQGSSPAEVGLREVIEEQRSWAEPLPAQGWRLLSESETSAQFSRGRLEGRLEWLGLERESDGGWSSDGYSGDCEPTPELGLSGLATWNLARKQKRLTPRTRTLWINLGPGGCASGALQNPRAHFRFRQLGTKLLMIAWLESVGGGLQTCQGTIEPPRKVRLPAPLGELRLFDGATFPPVPAGKTRDRYY